MKRASKEKGRQSTSFKLKQAERPTLTLVTQPRLTEYFSFCPRARCGRATPFVVSIGLGVQEAFFETFGPWAPWAPWSFLGPTPLAGPKS